MHQRLILAKVLWKLAKLELGQCRRKIEIAPVLLLGSNFSSHMVSWLQLRIQGARGVKVSLLFCQVTSKISPKYECFETSFIPEQEARWKGKLNKGICNLILSKCFQIFCLFFLLTPDNVRR